MSLRPTQSSRGHDAGSYSAAAQAARSPAVTGEAGANSAAQGPHVSTGGGAGVKAGAKAAAAAAVAVSGVAPGGVGNRKREYIQGILILTYMPLPRQRVVGVYSGLFFFNARDASLFFFAMQPVLVCLVCGVQPAAPSKTVLPCTAGTFVPSYAHKTGPTRACKQPPP